MANKDAAFGLRPVGKLGGNPNNGALTGYKLLSSYATAVYQNSGVITNAGYINIGAATADLVGSCNGFKFDDATTGKPTFTNFHPASAWSATADVFVYDDPYQVFEIQGVSGTAFAVTMPGKMADRATATSGSTTTGMSADEIDLSGVGTTTAQLKILAVTGDPDNNDTAAHANVRVIIFEHEHQTIV